MFWFLRKPAGKQTVTVGTTASASSEVDATGYAGGTVTVSSGITLLTFYCSQTTGGTYLPLYDNNDVAVTLTVASTKITQLPQEVYDSYYIKVVGNTTGTAYIALKS